MSSLSPRATALINKYDAGDLAEQVVELEAEIERILEARRLENIATDGQIKSLQWHLDGSVDALEHCGYDPQDCIDCGGPPHNDTCRFWKLRHILSYWGDNDHSR